MKNNDIPEQSDREFAKKSLTNAGEWGDRPWGEDDSVAAVRARALAYLAKREAEAKPPEPAPDPYAKMSEPLEER